jgi:hypothetical protein
MRSLPAAFLVRASRSLRTDDDMGKRTFALLKNVTLLVVDVQL